MRHYNRSLPRQNIIYREHGSGDESRREPLMRRRDPGDNDDGSVSVAESDDSGKENSEDIEMRNLAGILEIGGVGANANTNPSINSSLNPNVTSVSDTGTRSSRTSSLGDKDTIYDHIDRYSQGTGWTGWAGSQFSGALTSLEVYGGNDLDNNGIGSPISVNRWKVRKSDGWKPLAQVKAWLRTPTRTLNLMCYAFALAFLLSVPALYQLSVRHITNNSTCSSLFLSSF